MTKWPSRGGESKGMTKWPSHRAARGPWEQACPSGRLPHRAVGSQQAEHQAGGTLLISFLFAAVTSDMQKGTMKPFKTNFLFLWSQENLSTSGALETLIPFPSQE